MLRNNEEISLQVFAIPGRIIDGEDAKAPCAMVPLKPNELRRDSPPPRAARGSTSTGIWNAPKDTSDDRCAFSLKAWLVRQKTETRAAKPTRAAARSRQRPPPTGVPPPTTRDPRPRPRPRGGPCSTSATRTARPVWPHQTPSKGLEQQRPPTVVSRSIARVNVARSILATIPRLDRRVLFRCRALPGSRRLLSCRRLVTLPRSAASATNRSAPSSWHSGHPVTPLI